MSVFSLSEKSPESRFFWVQVFETSAQEHSHCTCNFAGSIGVKRSEGKRMLERLLSTIGVTYPDAQKGIRAYLEERAICPNRHRTCRYHRLIVQTQHAPTAKNCGILKRNSTPNIGVQALSWSFLPHPKNQNHKDNHRQNPSNNANQRDVIHSSSSE